jgi:Transposase DDE domain group 1
LRFLDCDEAGRGPGGAVGFTRRVRRVGREMTRARLPFELDLRAEAGALTAHGGVPLLIEAFRVSGAAAVLDERLAIKRRRRGLTPSELVEGLFALWAAGGERCEDLTPLREDAALALLLGHGLPAPQTARDFLEAFDEAVPPLWRGTACQIPGEGERLRALAAASRRLIGFLQERAPQATATIDLDATILESHKRAARPTYDGRTGYQPVIALRAEQDVVLADEFRDGNVPAGTGNRRLVERAIAALPPGVGRIVVRADSAAYEQDLLRWLEAAGHGYGISADMSRELAAAIRALPETAWQVEGEDSGAIRHWAEVAYVPSDGRFTKDRPAPPRYLVSRVSKKQGALFADGGDVKHFAIVTNLPDPAGGSGLDLIRWQRGKAGTVEHAHHVLTNELAAEALPSQRFGANAAWFRLNVLLYNLLAAFKRVALPPELHSARPKRLRFVLLNTLGKVVRHAREMVLRLAGEARRRLADAARLALAAGPPRPRAA